MKPAENASRPCSGCGGKEAARPGQRYGPACHAAAQRRHRAAQRARRADWDALGPLSPFERSLIEWLREHGG